MQPLDRQAQIDQVTWYHEFDFGNGLRARSDRDYTRAHRRVWQFIERNLDAIDFRAKTVLDLGCWDGYWSFYAERRGARSVLASDDLSQSPKWATGAGLRLARELLGSNVEVNQHLSVYNLESLGRKFDVILCLGVYYHLVDPFAAFAQIRHCCHADTVVVLEGDGGLGLGPQAVTYDFGATLLPMFLPSAGALRGLLQSAYLDVQSQTWMDPPTTVKSVVKRFVRGQAASSRLVTVCKAFEGRNKLHKCEPPFGLHVYDTRFRNREPLAA